MRDYQVITRTDKKLANIEKIAIFQPLTNFSPTAMDRLVYVDIN